MGDDRGGARLTATVSPAVAAAYREAAAALGTSVAQVVREVLEDGVQGLLTTVEVTARVASGESQAAAAAYFQLAHEREAEAMDAMVQANTLMLEAPLSPGGRD